MTMTALQPATQPRTSLIAAMAARYHMEPSAFQATIKATVMPSGATNEQMAAFLLVANEYDLNPITKEIYAFPARGGGVTPVVGVDGWINLAQRRHEFDGIEHEWQHDEKGNPIACTCRVWRKDRTRPVVVTEFMDECRRPTDPWKSHPRRMLRHKATIQAIRYAFGFAGIKDEDDAEVIYANASVIEAPRSATVTDLNARLAATVERTPQPALEAPIETANAPANDEASDWPKAIPETGELADVRGIHWDARIHSSSRTCNDDGTWRRKRGADPELVARIERELLHVLPEPDAVPELALTGELSDFNRGLMLLREETTPEGLDGIQDWSRDTEMTDEERVRFEKAVDDRRAELA